MRIGILATAVALVLAAAACNRGGSDAGNDLSTDTNLAEDSGINDVLGANQSGSDAAKTPPDATSFVTAVAASDLFEIESTRLAASKAGSAEIKSLAQSLRADHEKSSIDLKAAAARANPPIAVAPALDAEEQGMLDDLKATGGADFDRRFIDQQTNAHQKALALLRNYVGSGDSQPLKDFASKATNVVQVHLDRLNSIRK
jgi:putative membrane protein